MKDWFDSQMEQKVSSICKKIEAYRENYYSLLSQELNNRADTLALSIKLHKFHKDIIKEITELFQEVFCLWEENSIPKELVYWIFTLLLRGDHVLTYSEHSGLYLENPSVESFIGFYEEDGVLTLSASTIQKCVVLYWDEDSENGYLGEELQIEDYKDPEFEKYLTSLGLGFEYEYTCTYHSRRIDIIGVQK